MNRRILCDLFPVCDPSDVLREVLATCGFDGYGATGGVVAEAYQTTVRLYRGEFAGYRACDTAYHDLTHAAETFLAMARLLHGARLAGEAISERALAVGLTAAILHDAGYIRRADEPAATGAHYRAQHEARSMVFVSQHGAAMGLTDQEISDCRHMIRGTIMAEDVNGLPFRSRSQELLVRMLSAADLLAQLSSATYLERLAFLFDEDRGSPEPRYRDLVDCYHKALAFDALARDRLDRHLADAETYLTRHFGARWNSPENLYRVAMDRQIRYLDGVLACNGFDPRRHLRRWGSLRTLQGQLP